MNFTSRCNRSTVTLLAAASAAFGGWAQAADFERCSRIAERDGRLACYDRYFPPVNGTTAGAAGSSNAAAPRPTAAAGPSREAAFGLPSRPHAAAEPGQITSRITGEFSGWEPGTRFRLTNGQVWEIEESSRTGGYALIDPKVRVTEGTFGGYYFEVEGVAKTPRVKRVK